LSYLSTFFAFVNSTYSFYWDISKDWDLTLFTSSRADPDCPYGLRRRRFFSDRLYYAAILTDLLIRFSWVTRFVPGFVWLSEKECGIFLLMALEVARRWMWIFFRAEAEMSKSSSPILSSLDADSKSAVRNSRDPAMGDILLGEFNGKLDAD
jgi:hypothetical protein